MSGRINEEDIATVRERARIDEIVGSHVALRNAGSGTMKGLCPFHDEKTPSFQVNPSRGFYYCFGCGEGGDVISFVQKIDNLSFVETVERLADRVGVQLRYTDGGAGHPERGLRLRLMEAHQAAAEFYADQLNSAEAMIGRQFLSERGFDRTAAERFGVGYAPQDGKALKRHLTGRGFSDPELVGGGLVRESGWDYFQGRLLWPIRDSGTQVLGFGARRLLDDDRMPAKYLNTPETALYKKSHVLYGLDLARQQIGKTSQAVVVEGYTDVMAAHLSGVETAVASCGTAFGDDHARLLRRLMGNHDAFRGEVIFTFDGDAAGQAAALKVFGGDANFIGQTYVAVEPSGLDPCDLRLQQGEAAVRELVARRVPLYRFVMANVLSRHDLDRADGRLSALREAAPLVASVRDYNLSSGYVRELSNMLGMDVEEVRQEVARTARGGRPKPDNAREGQAMVEQSDDRRWLPDPADRLLLTERETTKLLLQAPALFDPDWLGLEASDFTHRAYAALFRAIQSARTSADGGHGSEGAAWVHRVATAVPHELLTSLVASLAVEPLSWHGPATEQYAYANAAKLRLLTVMRQVNELKSKLQRMNPVQNPTGYNQMFSELVILEARRNDLHTQSLRGPD
ncbi:MAG: DNA primase [Microlunatus sp.]|nr:DNA primase [Microlunatus sp.]MDN5769974.1 DNA primase [Microlunatus sp.]MDN5803097.1 DNA primase [Microlunatus sp.]